MAGREIYDDKPPWPTASEPSPLPDTGAIHNRPAPVASMHEPVVLRGPFVFFTAGVIAFWAITMGAMAVIGALDAHPHGKYDRIVAPAIFGPISLLLLWAAIRAARMRVEANNAGLEIHNIMKSKALSWSNVKACSAVYCGHGEGSSWRAVITGRDDRKVAMSALSSISGLSNRAAKAKVESRMARLRHLAPPGITWELGDSAD